MNLGSYIMEDIRHMQARRAHLLIYFIALYYVGG